jgi:hypothetical protein
LSSNHTKDQLTEERWARAVTHAETALAQYKALPNTDEYSWTLWSIENWLYLAKVWDRKVIVVLEHLESTTFDLVKCRDRRSVGPLGKGGSQTID